MKLIRLLVIIVLFISCKKDKPNIIVEPQKKTITVKAADISQLPQLRQYGTALYNTTNQLEDAITTLKTNGINTIRLRIWHNPTDTTSNLKNVKKLAQECKANGLKILLTVHYSDTWADPGNQVKPAAWANASGTNLLDSVYNYTRLLMQEINPEYIQIGNEINGGLLLPQGSSSNTTQMKSILQKGIDAVRSVNTSTKIILHYAGHSNAAGFFTAIGTLDYDIIGISYYPFWHGKDLTALQSNLDNLGRSFGKQTMIVETAYPFTLQWNDFTNNIVGLPSHLLDAYTATPSGQKAYLEKIIDIAANSTNCLGICYWGAEWISYKGSTATNASTWENCALWDFTNKAVPAIEAFK